MKKTIIILQIVIFLYLGIVYSQTNDCGNGVLEPGEYCDKNSNTDAVEWFDDINSCNKVNPDWQDIPGQGLDCYAAGSTEGQPCQLDVSGCEDTSDDGPGGRSCGNCNECNEVNSFNGNSCTQRECSYQCPAFGNCYYTPGFFGEPCTECTDANVNQCEDYENEFDCNANVCAGNSEMRGRICEWIGGRCRENLDCTWNCDGLYGPPDASGFCNKVPGESCELEDWINRDPDNENQGLSGTYKQECLARNPADNYPDQIICKELQENFPVFTNINIILTIILLIGYYTISIKRKKIT